MSLCYCKTEIEPGARQVTMTVDWGKEDLRDTWAGPFAYCSFGCAADHFRDLAVKHDGHVVVEGRDEAHGNEVPA